MLDKTLYCIGHDDYSLDEFITILKKLNITILVDVRADPDHGLNKVYNQTALREKLAQVDIVYHWAGRQFGEQRESRNDSIHTQLPSKLMGFADYMQGYEFPRAVMQLVNLSTKGKMTLMCAESRSNLSHCDLIADYLSLQGMRVKNIDIDGNATEYSLSINARRESAELIYDRIV